MNTLKSFFAIFSIVFLTGAIFNVTILKTYADAKTLEAHKLARLKAASVNRLPAVVSATKVKR